MIGKGDVMVDAAPAVSFVLILDSEKILDAAKMPRSTQVERGIFAWGCLGESRLVDVFLNHIGADQRNIKLVWGNGRRGISLEPIVDSPSLGAKYDFIFVLKVVGL